MPGIVPGELTGTIAGGVAMVVRPWAGRPDTAAMQQLASRRWPHGPHAGGVGWAAAIGQLADEIVVVDGDAGVAGWAGLAGQELFLHADPAHPGPPSSSPTGRCGRPVRRT